MTDSGVGGVVVCEKGAVADVRESATEEARASVLVAVPSAGCRRAAGRDVMGAWSVSGIEAYPADRHCVAAIVTGDGMRDEGPDRRCVDARKRTHTLGGNRTRWDASW